MHHTNYLIEPKKAKGKTYNIYSKPMFLKQIFEQIESEF